jgi:hypothetical protein
MSAGIALLVCALCVIGFAVLRAGDRAPGEFDVERVDDEGDGDAADNDAADDPVDAALRAHRVTHIVNDVPDLARVDDEGDVDLEEDNFVPHQTTP